MNPRSRLAVPMLLLLAAAPLTGQDMTSVRGEWVVGGSIGVPGYGWETEPELFTAGVHATYLEELRPGGEMFLGTMPRFLVGGDIALGARGGLAVPVPVSAGVLLLPSAGVGFIAALSGGTGAGLAGVNAGIAALVLGERSGFRAGITWHRFHAGDGLIWLLEIGFVRRRPSRVQPEGEGR